MRGFDSLPGLKVSPNYYWESKSRSFSPSRGSLKKGAKKHKSKTAAKNGKRPTATRTGETNNPIEEINDPPINLTVLPFEEDKYLKTFLIKTYRNLILL